MIRANELAYWSSLGRLDQVREALLQTPDINELGQDGYTAMHAAAENGHLEVLRFLIENGAELNPRVTSGQTPLTLAAAADQAEAVALLQSHGATI
jgi:ankyrin repeat protein